MAKHSKKVAVRVTRGRELSASEIERVAGGEINDVTQNKQKGADKAAAAADALIRG